MPEDARNVPVRDDCSADCPCDRNVFARDPDADCVPVPCLNELALDTDGDLEDCARLEVDGTGCFTAAGAGAAGLDEHSPPERCDGAGVERTLAVSRSSASSSRLRKSSPEASESPAGI